MSMGNESKTPQERFPPDLVYTPIDGTSEMKRNAKIARGVRALSATMQRSPGVLAGGLGRAVSCVGRLEHVSRMACRALSCSRGQIATSLANRGSDRVFSGRIAPDFA